MAWQKRRIPGDEDPGLGHFEGQSCVVRDNAGEPGKQRKHDTELCSEVNVVGISYAGGKLQENQAGCSASPRLHQGHHREGFDGRV